MTASVWLSLVQYATVAIVAAALVQVALMLVSSFQRYAGERAQRRLALADLAHRAERALARARSERERVELSWNGFRKFEIRRKVRETRDVCSFYLVPHDGKPVPPFLPGQYLTFQLRIPGEAKPVIRCYSLSDSPSHTDHYRVSIKKVRQPLDAPDAPPGLVSSFLHDKLDVGEILDVKAPNGHFHLDPVKETPVVLIAGGIGVTPVLSMLNAICESNTKRETWFFLGLRNGDDYLMRDHFERLDRENENVRLYVCFSDPGGGEMDESRGLLAEVASVDLLKRLLPANNYDFYICGPPPMMNSMTRDLMAWGVPDDRVHFEAFGPATVKRSAPAEAKASQAAGTEIRVTFARSGKVGAWQPEAGSLLDFAEANGVNIEFGCRAGNCGTCITAVKAGEVDYMGDPGALPVEQGSCLTCIAIPKTALTLDA